ncbi:hypothetical protein HDA36_006300 [Nocardiopsis composta]|uniref:Uncharacterized protein n=1 Tax=Nocardiopsis composta TaxID=157465 RepID=A0A7W8VH20_9ACTN|nr:hypothetical protein [Nocardiopsis composta]
MGEHGVHAGAARALLTSMERMSAAACGLRSVVAQTMPSAHRSEE